MKRSLLLLLILLACETVLGGIAYAADGRSGVAASLAALLTCVAGGFLALLTGDFLNWLLHKQFAGLAQSVCGIFVRAGFSLAACALAYGFRWPISEHGFVFYVLAFYMVTLAVETGFAVRQFSEMDFVPSDAAGESA